MTITRSFLSRCDDPTDCAIILFLWSEADERGVCPVSISSIARSLHMTWPTASRHIKKLMGSKPPILSYAFGRRGFQILTPDEEVLTPQDEQAYLESEMEAFGWDTRIAYFAAALMTDDLSGGALDTVPEVREQVGVFLDTIASEKYQAARLYVAMFPHWDSRRLLDYLERKGYMVRGSHGWRRTEKLTLVLAEHRKYLAELD